MNPYRASTTSGQSTGPATRLQRIRARCAAWAENVALGLMVDGGAAQTRALAKGIVVLGAVLGACAP